MGNPNIYYKDMLQQFAYNLTCMKDMKLAMSFWEENSIEKLEEYIERQKYFISDPFFYYKAGMACQAIVDEIYKNGGNDDLNACIGGFYSFEDFIGIRDFEEDD